MRNRIERERKFWDSFAGRYDTFMGKSAEKAYLYLLEMFVKDTSHSQNLLETATGTGSTVLKLSKHIPTITATDLSPEMIKIARAKAEKLSAKNIRFKVQDICNLSFSDNSFDTVIASNVLHLLFEPGLAMQEMKRVLKPGGIIIVPTYCHGETLISHICSRCMTITGFRVRTRWSMASFRTFIETNGFEVIKYRTIKGIIPMTYLVAKIYKKEKQHEKIT